MWLNVVYAIRHVRRRPILTAVAVASLALGIGCALACASVLNTVLFRALPYRDTNQLVVVWENNSKRGVGLTPTSVMNYLDLKAQSSSFEELGALSDGVYSVDGPNGSERANGYRTTAGLLEQTGVAPLVGRVFTRAEDRPGGSDVVVLGHGLWQRRFGGDPQIVGRTIQLSGVPHTVVGVMPRGFVLPPVFAVRLVGTDIVLDDADLWVPMRLDKYPQRRDLRFLFLIGRVKAQQTVAQAQSEASTIARRLATDYPVDDLSLDFSVVPLQTQVLTSVQTLLVLLPVIGLLVLVIAATDAAHLLLADVLTLAGETSVRWALGATSWRLAGELGAMSVLWCGLATAAAWVIAAAIQVPVAAYAHAQIPRLNELRLDGSVALLAIVIALTLAAAISLLPMLHARNAGSARSVQGTAAPTGMPRWRRVFVIVQLAVAVIVLSTAALLFRSAASLSRIDPGFAADGVSVFEMMLPPSRYATPPSRISFQRRLLEAAADLPGARAAVVDYVPFGGSASIVNFTVENYLAANAMAKPRASLLAVSGGYFETLSIPQIDGRRLVAADEADGATAVVVNDAFARRYITDGRVLGRRVKRGEADSKNPWMSIVGVVGSGRGAGLTMEPQPEVFIPYVRGGSRGVTNLLVQAGTPTAMLAPAVLERVHRVDAALSPTEVTTMRALLERAVGQPTFYARLFAVLALVACVLSLTGVYGVAVLGVSARSNEIAIRSCLGAQRRDIVVLVMRETAVAVGIAVAAGAAGAWLLQRRIAVLVYGAESSDWLMIALSSVVLSLLAFAAVHTAVRKVVQLRPLDLLRHGAGALA